MGLAEQLRDALNEATSLRRRLAAQVGQLRDLEASNARLRTQLDATHWVWCSGGCDGGVHREDGLGPAGITDAIVAQAIHNTDRLVTWSYNREFRAKWKAGGQFRVDWWRVWEQRARDAGQDQRADECRRWGDAEAAKLERPDAC